LACEAAFLCFAFWCFAIFVARGKNPLSFYWMKLKCFKFSSCINGTNALSTILSNPIHSMRPQENKHLRINRTLNHTRHSSYLQKLIFHNQKQLLFLHFRPPTFQLRKDLHSSSPIHFRVIYMQTHLRWQRKSLCQDRTRTIGCRLVHPWLLYTELWCYLAVILMIL